MNHTARWALLAVCVLLPAVSFRVGGIALWVLLAVGYAVVAAGALYALHDDGELKAAFRYQQGDPAIGLITGVMIAFLFKGATEHLIAPVPFLRACTLDGPLVDNPDATGVHVFTELVRSHACKALGRSAALPTGPLRAIATLGIAILEEVAWRAGAQRWLSDRLGSTRGYVAAALLFPLSQLLTGNVSLALIALPVGFLWGALFRWRGSLVPSILSHATFSYFLLGQWAPFEIRNVITLH